MKRKLFTPYILGSLELKNRFVMAPMTRARSSQPGDVPNAMMARYYAQRGSASLIITESAQISLQGKGYMRSPGVYTQAQIQGWKQITRAVHARKSKIYLQLCHVGAVSASEINGLQPIAPSTIASKAKVYYFQEQSDQLTYISTETPKAMTIKDIQQVVDEFVRAARCAIEAGFDGVEIHAANGYLIDQFLRTTTNKRKDAYGGGLENRVRFLVEVIKNVSNAVGADQIGVRFSPYVKAEGTNDPLIEETLLYAIERMDEFKIGYIHLCEPDWKESPKISDEFRQRMRKLYSRTIIVTGDKTPDEAERLLQANYADLIGFGRSFLANPDFPCRVLQNAPMNSIDDYSTLFNGYEKGYIDYPYWRGEL